MASGGSWADEGLEFQVERLFDVWEEAKSLTLHHAEEVGKWHKSLHELAYDQYRAMDTIGFIRLFTARVDGELVGYSTFIITNHPHYKSIKMGIQDGLYFLPEFRGFNSIKFIKWCDERLEEEGVQAISRHVTCKKDYSKVLKRCGYEAWEVNYIKELRNGA